MGYCTSYKLTWKLAGDNALVDSCNHKKDKDAKFCPTCGIPVKRISALETLNERVEAFIKSHENMNYAISTDGSMNDSCKWYEHEDDMIKLSKAIPYALFELNGEGEESGDIWKKYFLNGKSQISRAVLTFAPCTLKL